MKKTHLKIKVWKYNTDIRFPSGTHIFKWHRDRSLAFGIYTKNKFNHHLNHLSKIPQGLPF